MLRFSNARLAVGVAFFCLAPTVSAQAQAKAYSLTDVLELVQGSVTSSRILKMIGKSCLSFKVTKEVESVLRNAGADNALIAGLGSHCYKGDDAVPTPSVKVPKKPIPKPPVPADDDETTYSFTDLVGDAENVPNITGKRPDLQSLSATVTPIGVRFRVRFAPASFNPSTSLAQIHIDTDNNGDSGFTRFGSEVVLNLGAGQYYGGKLNVFLSREGAVEFYDTKTIPFSVRADGFEAFLPFDQIPSLGSVLRFQVASSYSLGESSQTGIVDRLPNSHTYLKLPIKRRR